MSDLTDWPDHAGRMEQLAHKAATELQKALDHLHLAASEHAASVAALTSALAESHAERDRLAEQLRKTRKALEIQQYWCRIDPTDQAVFVLCDVEQDEGGWDAIVRNRKVAERLAELVENDDHEIWHGRGLAVLDGAMTVVRAAIWNFDDPVKRPIETHDAVEFDWHTRPRPPQRIPVVLGALEALWLKCPDMRLGQLLSAVGKLDMWNAEDEQWLAAFEAFDKTITP